MAKYGLIPKSFLGIYALIPKSFVAKFGLIPKSLGCLPTAGNAFGYAQHLQRCHDGGGGACTQGSVLSPATLGWGNATLTALLLLVETPL